jgi:hypothetical protein
VLTSVSDFFNYFHNYLRKKNSSGINCSAVNAPQRCWFRFPGNAWIFPVYVKEVKDIGLTTQPSARNKACLVIAKGKALTYYRLSCQFCCYLNRGGGGFFHLSKCKFSITLHKSCLTVKTNRFSQLLIAPLLNKIKIILCFCPQQKSMFLLGSRRCGTFPIFNCCCSGFLRSDTLIGTVLVKVQPLETVCEIHDSFPVSFSHFLTPH